MQTSAPGITISPIVLMNGEHHFNEVIFSDVFIPDDDVLGQIGDGWHQVTAELGFERSGPERILSTATLVFSAVRALAGHDVDESTAARLWVIEVVTPTEHVAHAAVNNAGTAIQAYCDLLEVRWLLSEQAGHDVGTNAALAALRGDVIPTDAAAKMAIAEVPTAPLAIIDLED